MTELAALRNDLLQGGMIDSYEAAELLRVFLTGTWFWGFGQGRAGRGRPRRDGGVRSPGPDA